MSDRHLFLRDSRLSGNYIPVGRQLPRTPPFMNVKKQIDFCDEDSNEDYKEPEQNMEVDTREQENTMFDFNTVVTKTEPDDPNSMLKGMKGYRLTKSDLEFLNKMKEEKLFKKLRGDLAESQKLLKNEMIDYELVCASREKARAELQKFPSCEDLSEWIKVVLEMTSPSSNLTDLDPRSLLAMVTRESIQKAIDEKLIELNEMKKMLENKRDKEAEVRGQLGKKIAHEQFEIQGLMSQLSDLKSQLAQQKEIVSNLQEAPEAEQVDIQDEVRAGKRQRKHQGNGRPKAVKSTEKMQDTANRSKSIKRKKADKETSVKDEEKSDTLKAKQKSGGAAEKPIKSIEAARGPQQKVDKQESYSLESVQAVRGKRKPPGPAQTATSQPKNPSRMKTVEAPSTSQQAARSQGKKKSAGAASDTEQEAKDTVLRRSKRIASRR